MVFSNTQIADARAIGLKHQIPELELDRLIFEFCQMRERLNWDHDDCAWAAVEEVNPGWIVNPDDDTSLIRWDIWTVLERLR